MTPHGRGSRSYLYLQYNFLIRIRISTFFFLQNRRLPLKYLILELILREVLRCASARFIYLIGVSRNDAVNSTPSTAARESHSDLSAFTLRSQKYVQYKHEY